MIISVFSVIIISKFKFECSFCLIMMICMHWHWLKIKDMYDSETPNYYILSGLPKIINEDKSQALCLHYFSAWASLEKM